MSKESGLSAKDRKILRDLYEPKIIKSIRLALRCINDGRRGQNGLGNPVSEFWSDYYIAGGITTINQKLAVANTYGVALPKDLIPEEVNNFIQERTPWAEEFINKQAELIGFLGIERYASEFAVYD